MENNISIEMQDQDKSRLPSWGIAIVLFVLIAGLINYVYFKDIFLVSEDRAEDFVMKNFLIYNLALKAIIYPFKFIGVAGLILLGCFLFKVEHIKFAAAIKIAVLAELVKYLPETLKIFWFMFIDYDALEGFDLVTFNDYLSLNGLLGFAKENTIYPFFKYLSITQGLYIMAVAQLLKMDTDKTFMYHLQWFGITYGISVLLIGLISIVISL